VVFAEDIIFFPVVLKCCDFSRKLKTLKTLTGSLASLAFIFFSYPEILKDFDKICNVQKDVEQISGDRNPIFPKYFFETFICFFPNKQIKVLTDIFGSIAIWVISTK
jgi:hypothetical protein